MSTRTNKRVLHITQNLDQGGCERLLEQFSRQMQPLGIESHFFAYDCPKIQGIGKAIESAGFNIIHYKKKAGWDFEIARLAKEAVIENKIDIIHTHDLGALTNLFYLKFKCPVKKIIHTEHALHYWLYNRNYRYQVNFASRFIDRFVACSPSMETELRASTFIPKQKLSMIFNGVDVSKFNARQSTYQPGQPLKIVNISRHSPEKNLEFLLRELSSLKKAGIVFGFDQIGSGDEAYQKSLKDLADQLNISDCVTWHGFQSDVRPFLENKDLFVSASKTEGHPVAVLEAMAMRLPVLISDIAPHKIIESAMIFPLTASKLSQNLQEIAKGNIDLSSSSKQSRSEIESRFSLVRMAENYTDLYHK